MRKIIAILFVVFLIGFNTTIQAQDAPSIWQSIGNEIDRTEIEQISPNPIENSVTVGLLSKDYNSKIEIRVLNIIGNTVKTLTLESSRSLKFDLSDLSSGPYILSLYEDGRHVDSQRIFKK